MKALRALVLVLVLAAAGPALGQDTQAPPSPVGLTVAAGTPVLNGVVFRLTWPVALDPPSNTPVPTYQWSAGFSDGQISGGSVAYVDMTPGSPAMTLTMPYHASGQARTGWACIKSRDAAGNVSADQSCAPVPVPATPAAPPATTTILLEYDEPSTNDCTNRPTTPCASCNPVVLPVGTPCPSGATCVVVCTLPLEDLAKVRAYYTIGSGAEQQIDFMASRPQGGIHMSTSFVVNATSGVLRLQVTALDLTGNESVRSGVATKDLALAKPGEGGVTVITITVPK